MIPIVTPDEMRAIDGAAPEPVDVLIERAGAAVARQALDMLGGSYGRVVVVIAGPGNNGADGRVAGRLLTERGVAVHVIDARQPPDRIKAADLVIDAAYGTGFRGAWAPPDVGGAPVLAVDVPTGLDALTGIAAPGTLVAERTVTFAAAKPGHVLGDGPDHVGKLVVADIGLDLDLAEGRRACGIVEAVDVSSWLPSRRRTAHKWQRAVRVVAGSSGMGGAMWLCAAAAYRAGAGMVVVSTPGADPVTPVEAVQHTIPKEGWAAGVLDGDRSFPCPCDRAGPRAHDSDHGRCRRGGRTSAGSGRRRRRRPDRRRRRRQPCGRARRSLGGERAHATRRRVRAARW